MKVKIRNGTKNFILGIVVVLCILVSSVDYCNAASGSVIFYLNGGTIAGFTDGGTKSGTSGTSISIPAPPSKTGYTFKGWLQQGNSGIGPWGKPVWSDGEFVSRAATDICAKYLYPVSTTVVKVAKPADCQTKVSSNVVRITIKEDGKYSGVDDYVSLIWSSEMNVLANSNIKCMMYAKIPTGYSITPATSGATTPGTTLLNGDYIYYGTGEYQYYESTYFNGNGTQGYGLFAIRKMDKSLPDPTPANPLVIDIGYYNYTKCDGSAGTGLGNGTGTYYYNLAGTDYLTAIFDPNIYNITYDANGGSGAPAMQSYGYNTSKTLALTGTTPTRAGYTFLGWSTNKDATTAEYQPGYAWSCGTMSNTTLYAVWKFINGGILKTPKTLIVDAATGKCTFKITSTIVSGTINVTVPNTINLNSTNKDKKVGTINLSSTYLNPSSKTITGTITAPNLTAGPWNGSFNIHYSYTP